MRDKPRTNRSPGKMYRPHDARAASPGGIARLATLCLCARKILDRKVRNPTTDDTENTDLSGKIPSIRAIGEIRGGFGAEKPKLVTRKA